MIWFFRIFSVFILVLAIATYSQNESSLTRSTKTDLKFEPIVKVILQSYGSKLLRLPAKDESIEGKLGGEDIKILVRETAINEKIALEISGISHVEKESLEIVFSEKENYVQMEIHLAQTVKSDLLSRLVFLFFGAHGLEQRMANFLISFPNSN